MCLWVTGYRDKGQKMRTFAIVRGKSPGQRSLVDHSPWGCKESDTTYGPSLRLAPNTRFAIATMFASVGQTNEWMSEWDTSFSCTSRPTVDIRHLRVLGPNDMKLICFHTENVWFPTPHPTMSTNINCFILKASSLGLWDHLAFLALAHF